MQGIGDIESVTPAATRRSVMRAEVGIVFNTPNDRLWVPRIRQWVATNDAFLNRLGLKPEVTSWRTPPDALAWRAEASGERLVIAIGFDRGDVEDGRELACGEPIVVHSPAKAGAAAITSSSVLNTAPVIACSDITTQLRKSLIRIALRQRRIVVRSPSSDAEMSGYFSLRYKVWKSIGYLRGENARTRTQWEIDFWDRTAVPLCAIAPDGKIMGCLRLISNLGDEEPSYVAKIERLLGKARDPHLSRLFSFQHTPMHPFDVLCEFPGFRAKFRELMQRRTNVAEVGRVAVDPDYRGQCIAEILVDSAVSLAQSRRVACLFLACRDELGPLYAKSGFAPVPGLRSEKFFNIQAPSIIMERWV